MEIDGRTGLIGCAMLALLVINGADAAIHSVGSDDGWGVPSDPTLYSTWATKEKTFYLQDQLQFLWSTGTHNVANATKEEYDNCAKTAKVLTSNSGDLIDLTTSGPQYFICTIGNHCQSGQKLAISVISGTNPFTPSPTQSPPPPPPPPNSASALASVALYAAVVFTIVITSPFITYI